MIQFNPNTKDTRYQYNQLARHIFICKLLSELRIDLMICEIEGWDKMEYINMIYEELFHFKMTEEKGDRLNEQY